MGVYFSIIHLQSKQTPAAAGCRRRRRWISAVAVNCRSFAELPQLRWIVAVAVNNRKVAVNYQLQWIAAVSLVNCCSCGELPQLWRIAAGSCKLLRLSVAPAALPEIGSNSGVKCDHFEKMNIEHVEVLQNIKNWKLNHDMREIS